MGERLHLAGENDFYERRQYVCSFGDKIGQKLSFPYLYTRLVNEIAGAGAGAGAGDRRERIARKERRRQRNRTPYSQYGFYDDRCHGGKWQRSAGLKTKHLSVGVIILAVAVVSTALLVYLLTSSSTASGRTSLARRRFPADGDAERTRFEPPDPEVPLPPSHSVLHAFKTGAVCTDGPPCSRIGRDILDRGGSAVDSTLAALFCNGVVNSQSMGLGGGFIMTIYNRTAQRAYSLVSREVAPLKATKEMFMKNQEKSRTGVLATGVPGELRGYWTAWKRFGRLPWKEIVKPSIKICRDGYHMTKHQYDSLSFRPKELLLADPNFREWFVHPDTNEFKPPGSLIRPTRLCDTLQTIADNGGDDLYNGTLAKLFVEDIKEMGGIITMEDMEKMEPKWREPIVASLHGQQTVYTAPPPGSGALLAFILNIIDGYQMNPSSVADINRTILTTHRMVEAYKYAFALRTELADPDFVDISSLIKNITSKEYAEEVRHKIRDDRTFNDSDHYGAIYYNQEDHGTAHISVLAQNGDAVSVTSTINLYLGAGLTSKRTGIILNSGMDDFSVPGIVNYFGVQPSPNNFIEPHKTSLSSVAPTIIVDKNGNVTMVIGASGGTKITSAAASVISSYTWFNKTLKEAVDESRIHHQLHPMEINYEYGVIDPVVKGLKNLGHKMTRYRDRGSIVCALARQNSTVYANADYRKGGEVYGVD